MLKARDLKGNRSKVYFSGIDKTYVIRFNLEALYFLEKQYGDIDLALKAVQSGKIKSLISITTAALNAGRNREEEFTEEEVTGFIEMDDLEPLSEALQEMMGVDPDQPVTPSTND